MFFCVSARFGYAGQRFSVVCVHDLGVLACVTTVLVAVDDEKSPQLFMVGCCSCAVSMIMVVYVA